MAAFEGQDGQCWGEQLVPNLLEAFFLLHHVATQGRCSVMGHFLSEPGKPNAHTL